ncbi:MAG TPA: hypothetical protein HPP97_13255 [Desulfuromonadales bacterium]|nr:hypothetical protein [Desulfuromonadales bacterium]
MKRVLFKHLPIYVLSMVTAAILIPTGSALAVVNPQQGAAMLLDTYTKNRAKLSASSFGVPLFLNSFEQSSRVNVDVYGVFDFPFNSVVSALKVPSSWCDIVSLHPNVKACTYSKEPDSGQLIFYIGKKVYQPPEEARQVRYQYRTVVQQRGYLDILLTADTGPFGTEDHTMRFEALPLEGGKTFVHVNYAYNDSVALRLAEKAYFATLGRSKVGFTVTGTDRSGMPVYIGGPRGAIERNAVRYYFAIQTCITTVHSPDKTLFNTRIDQWYDRTTLYKKQLLDLSKKEYLESKSRELENQVILQKQVQTRE